MSANVKGSSYSIKIRKGLVERIGLEVLRLSDEKEHEIALITDEKVSGLYLQNVIINAKECPKSEGTRLRICELLIGSHEGTKNFGLIEKLLEDMAALGLSKQCVVVALGGGVVCDAAGFAAACYLGGVRLVLVPTTLAAMVKASAGNYARVNLSAGENLAGMSCTPSLVLCDTDCLKTLPDDEYRSGLAEALKTAIVSGEEMFRLFTRKIEPDGIERVIEECIKFRASIAGDEGRLRGLKLGCVVGSAIGALSGYGIQHGLATAQGIGITARASAKMGWCSEDTAGRIITALNAHNLPDNCVKYKAADIARTAAKSWGRVVDMVVPCGIGPCTVKQVKAEDLEHVISLGIKG